MLYKSQSENAFALMSGIQDTFLHHHHHSPAAHFLWSISYIIKPSFFLVKIKPSFDQKKSYFEEQLQPAKSGLRRKIKHF